MRGSECGAIRWLFLIADFCDCIRIHTCPSACATRLATRGVPSVRERTSAPQLELSRSTGFSVSAADHARSLQLPRWPLGYSQRSALNRRIYNCSICLARESDSTVGVLSSYRKHRIITIGLMQLQYFSWRIPWTIFGKRAADRILNPLNCCSKSQAYLANPRTSDAHYAGYPTYFRRCGHTNNRGVGSGCDYARDRCSRVSHAASARP